MDITDFQNDNRFWTEFAANLKKGQLSSDRVLPYYEPLRNSIMRFLSMIREKASWEEFEAMPEVHRVGNHVHYLIPLTIDGKKDTYCFTLLIEGNTWYFRHMESIVIRLDKISSLPTSTFPEIPESQKSWILEEFRASEMVRLFNFLSKEKGKSFAFNWFKDGAGYFLSAKTWVPFVPEARAFILFLCWEQANLRGNSMTLEKLDDNEAILRMKSNYLKLYTTTGHLNQQISFEDYQRIFETIWQDRAKSAGWYLRMTYEQTECSFHFKREV